MTYPGDRHFECFQICISDVIDMFQIEVPMFPLILGEMYTEVSARAN